MPLKILVKRDSVTNFTASGFVPRDGEITSAYDTGAGSLIFKLGDGKTPWTALPEITKISELASFKVYTRSNGKETAEIILNPFKIDEYLDGYQIKECL